LRVVRYRTSVPRPGDPTERDDLGYLLAKASRHWDDVLRVRCRAHGFPEVRPAFGSVLLPLFQRDGQRMGELAAAARISKQNMTTLVREVEHSGLVRRRADVSDRRAQRVWLTDRAEEFRPAATQIQAEMSALVSRELSPRSVAILRRSLAAISSMAETLDGASGSRRTPASP
jgi:DNA-binding MarR family transcriptional regulator